MTNEIQWQEVVDKYNTGQQKVLMDLKPNEFTASILTGCVRQAVKNKMRLQEYDLETLRNFQIGHMFHRHIQQECALGFLDRPVEFEKRIIFEHDGVKIFGHVDAYDGENIYDFKTTSDIKMSQRYDIHIGYVYQLSTYLHALNAKKAFIVYVSKKDFAIHQKEITPYNKEYISRFCHEVMEACAKYDEKGLLPPRDKCFICAKEFAKK
jgi:hypothetical protein